MKTITSHIAVILAVLLSISSGASTASLPVPTEEAANASKSPVSCDMKKAETEVDTHYVEAQPDIKEFVLWTARTFGPIGLWFNEDTFSALSDDAREEKIRHLANLLEKGEYGRQLCEGLAEAGALKDKRLVAGLIKVAGYHRENRGYDCRPKWMAVAALARQESDEATPLLISLVNHGNQNTRNWARAALSRKTGQDFKQDTHAWAKWWQAQGHKPIDDELLKPLETSSQVALVEELQPPSDPEELQEARLQYEAELKAATDPIKSRYQQHIENLQKEATAKGDLEAALAIQKEIAAGSIMDTGKQVYLADMQEDIAQVGWGTFLKGELLDEKQRPLMVNRFKVMHGLFAHANSKVVYDISGQGFSSLQGGAGLRDYFAGEVRFVLYGDGKKLWQSKILKGAKASPSIPAKFDISVRGVKILVLEVNALGSDRFDHAIWIDPILTH